MFRKNDVLSGRPSVALAAIAACALMPVRHAHAQLITDSVVDFSGVQGQDGWHYGYYGGTNAAHPYTPADFQEMPFYDIGINGPPAYWHNVEGGGGFFTLLRASRAHPNGRFTSGGRISVDQWAVRRWIAPTPGTIYLHTLWADLNTTCGNGVRARVYVGDDMVWTAVINSANETTFDGVFCVDAGTHIDFVVDPLESWDSCDNTGNTVQIYGPIYAQPGNRSTCVGGATTLSVGAASAAAISYQWRYNGTPLTNGGEFSGADTATLRIAGAKLSNSGGYDCVVTACGGSTTSRQATLRVCRADYNCDSLINSQDYFDFCMDLMSNTPRADINEDGFVNTQDFFDFITAFFAGC